MDREQLQQWFYTVDEDNDGMITAEELVTLLLDGRRGALGLLVLLARCEVA